MKITLPLRLVITLAVVAGLLLPALFSGWQTLRQQREVLTAGLVSDQQRLTAILATGLTKAFWDLDRGAAKLLLDAAGYDERVVRITVTSLTGQGFAEFHVPQRRHGQLIALTKQITWDGELLGHVRLEMDTGQLEARLNQDSNRFLTTAAAQLVLSLTLILVILNGRFIAPIKRLLAESAQLARRELDRPFIWQRRDELGRLGESLESTRLSLQAAFREIQESEQRFRSLTSLSSDWYWERDEEGRMTSISQGFQDITGIDPEELLSTRRGDLPYIIFPKSEHWMECQSNLAARAPFFDMEWQVMHSDGQTRYGVISGEPIFDSAGQFRGYRGIGKDLTAARLVEAAQQSAIRLRHLVEHLPAGAIYIEDGSMLLNAAAEKITGYLRNEITNTEQWFSKIFSGDAKRFQRQYLADKAAGFPAPREIDFIRKDGAPCTVEFAGYRDEYSEVWLLYEITERKRVEAALKQTLLEQHAIFDNTNAGIEHVKDRVIQRCNRGFEEMLGYAQGELTGQPCRIYYPSDEAWAAHGALAYAADGVSRALDLECEYIRKDGTRIWCSTHGKSIDPQDPSQGSIWVTQDITERRRTEAALKQALLEQQAIFDNASTGIVLLKDRVVQRCNRGFEEMLGYLPGELTGKSLRIVYPSDEAFEALGRLAYSVISEQKIWIGEWEPVRKDGVRRCFSGHGRAIDTQDLSKGVIWVAQDITERKQAEAALVEARDRLERGLAEVEQTHSEMTLLSELSSFLQACQSAQEAYAAIGAYAPRLFPDGMGALYVMDDAKEALVEMARWGDGRVRVESFLPTECWALRRGQPYRLDDPVGSLCCSHLHAEESRCFPYACLPLVAQGETFGLLSIEHRQDMESGKIELRHRLAVALAEQTGLALANIRLRDALRQQSIRDPLTGLYNRRHMNETIRRELARAKRKHAMLAVAIIDVDYFKQFNDTFGHDAGDHVLQNVARVLEQQVRQSDVVCRFGGEEFVVVLPEISRVLAEERAGDLLQAVRGLDLSHGNRSLGRITVSLGLALYPAHGEVAEALIEAADAALYQAKESGRNRLVVSKMMQENG